MLDHLAIDLISTLFQSYQDDGRDAPFLMWTESDLPATLRSGSA